MMTSADGPAAARGGPARDRLHDRERARSCTRALTAPWAASRLPWSFPTPAARRTSFATSPCSALFDKTVIIETPAPRPRSKKSGAARPPAAPARAGQQWHVCTTSRPASRGFSLHTIAGPASSPQKFLRRGTIGTISRCGGYGTIGNGPHAAQLTQNAADCAACDVA